MSLQSSFRHAFQPVPGSLLDGDVASVAIFDLHDWLPWLDEARELLDPAQRSRAERQRHPAAAEELALAYALHRLVLARATDMPAQEVPLQRDELGCPRLIGLPIHTSLSHASGHAAIAVAKGSPVGVDLEPIGRAHELTAISHLVCHSTEATELETIPDAAKGEWLLGTWVRKEAFLKAEGVGLGREMSSFVARNDSLVPSVTIPGASFRVASSEAKPGWILATAVAPGHAIHLAVPAIR